MTSYDQRLDTVVMYAWEAWTNNGLSLDDDERWDDMIEQLKRVGIISTRAE